MSKTQDLFNEAVRLHQSGRIREALSLYTKILPQRKNNALLLYCLGTANIQVGQHEAGVEQVRRSLFLNPKNAAAHNNLGLALKDLKRPDEALASYDKALALKPDFAEAYNNRGIALADLNRLDEALASYDRAVALKPDYAEAYNNRGITLTSLNRLDEALVSYDRALALKPDYPEANNNRGIALAGLNRLDEALASYDRALALKPDYAEACNNRGGALRGLNRLDEALASYDRALTLKPVYPEAYNNRGIALAGLNRLDEAVASYDRALALKPFYPEAYNNRGIALVSVNRLDEALASCDKALALKPDYAEAHNNRGVALASLNRLDEALASYDKALAPNPEYAEAHCSKSLLLLLMGRYREGWELFEWRSKVQNLKANYYTFPQAAWRGENDIGGKRIFIYGEQGLGDVIQFCRYLPRVSELAAETFFEVPASLVSFVSTLNCPMTVIAKGTPLPAFDAYCPVMSLPYAFKTTVETVPAEAPYLFSDKNKVEQWRQKLGARGKLKVGLAWSGSTAHKNDANRSIPLADLSPLFGLPVEWYSLQKEYREPDLAVLNQHPEIQQYQNDLQDFSDTAALIDCLDLVISVDTAVAHVAGALGKPAWILLPFMPDYRWMLDRDDTPWYPTARLFRQPRIGDWQSAIKMVAQSLDRTTGPIASSLTSI